MSQPRKALLSLTSFRGGLNDTDPPHRIGDDQLADALDVELTPSGGVQRRPGAQVHMPPPATGAVFPLLVRHTPSQDLSSTEVWALRASASSFSRSTSGTTWSTVSLSDTGASGASSVTDAVSFNGKLYIAYRKNSGLDRLHCWDGASIRRVGISAPSAPSVANQGTGSYAATLRYYRAQFVNVNGTTNKNVYSELSAAQSITPSGSGSAVRVTKPTTPDGATHWYVWASPDNVSYYRISTALAVATTTFDDATAPSAYATVDTTVAQPVAGDYTPPWSAKYLLVDDNRLVIAGAHDNARYVSRVGWSAIAGTGTTQTGQTNVQDDERFPTRNYLDLDQDEGGELTGMELLSGSIYVFKRYAIYKLVRTGNADTPYTPVTVSKGAGIGAISRRSIVVAEDEHGAPALYFLSERGPYRIGAQGLQYIGRDIEGTWSAVAKRSLTNGAPHGVYDAPRGRLHWWVSQNTAAGNTTRLTYHVKLGRPSPEGLRGGWTRTYNQSKPMYVMSSALLPSDLSARDSDLIPCAVHTPGAWSYQPVVWRYVTTVPSDETTDTTTGAVTGSEDVVPRFETKTFTLGLGQHGGVDDVYVLCRPASSTAPNLSVSLVRDFGAETRTKARAFTAATARLPQQITDLTLAQAQYVSVGVTSTTQQAWTIDEIALRVRREDPV